ncbi:MAG: hypothetical protein E7620_01610 [Ruminococcaceae bacterium]|nr:hypothetical protein [Oscillospiraceae bacterium]
MNDSFGYSDYRADYAQSASATKGNNAQGMSTAALTLGILSVSLTCCCCCLLPMNLILGALAVVFAFLSKSRNGGKLNGKARWGLILGILGILLFVLIMVIVFSGSPLSTLFEDAEAMEDWMEQVENYYQHPEDYPNGIPLPEGFE